MYDSAGRKIEYLRLSVTQRCQQRCAYCSRESGGKCVKDSELSPAQFIRIAKVCGELGFCKIRFTGGEPLMRRDLVQIVSGVSECRCYSDIAMTTNAQLLTRPLAQELKNCGLMRCNISLDSLDAEKYRAITGGELENVLRSIDLCAEIFSSPVKLNVVLIRGRNDDEIEDFFALARDNCLEVRFIELMPMGDGGLDGVSNEAIVRAHPFLQHTDSPAGAPVELFTAPGYKGKIGFISPITSCFCGSCNRIRITADGNIRPCLGDNLEFSLIDALSADDDTLCTAIASAVNRKPLRNRFGDSFTTDRKMNRIGG